MNLEKERNLKSLEYLLHTIIWWHFCDLSSIEHIKYLFIHSFDTNSMANGIHLIRQIRFILVSVIR